MGSSYSAYWWLGIADAEEEKPEAEVLLLDNVSFFVRFEGLRLKAQWHPP